MSSKQVAAGIRDALEAAGLDVYVASPHPKQVLVASVAILPEATRQTLRDIEDATGIAVAYRQVMTLKGGVLA